MYSRIMFIFRFGYAVNDFASLFLKKHLVHDIEKVREAYMKFFQNPSLEQRDLSSKMTIQISEIPEIGSVDKAVDLLLQFYDSFCYLDSIGFKKINDYYEKRDFNRLKYFLKDTPPSKDYDEKLRKILAEPILEASRAGRDL